MDEWRLKYDHFDPENQGLREALCTLGNGYFATRGAFAENSADGIHYPGTYVAGCYNRLDTEMVGRVIENEDLVNCPNWLLLQFKIGSCDWFTLKAVEILEFSQELALDQGVLYRTVRFRDSQGRITSLQEQRFVHMKYEHLAAIQWKLTAENWSGPLLIRAAIDGNVENSGVPRYKELNSRHLKTLETEFIDGNASFLKTETTQSEIRIALAQRVTLKKDKTHVEVKAKKFEMDGLVALEFLTELNESQTLTIEKIVSIFTSKDTAITECGLEAKEAIAIAPEFSELLESQTAVWKGLWEEFDLKLETEKSKNGISSLLILRLHLFHLLQTVSPNSIDLDAGVPARGWHGEAYRGHVFWDELFIFPTLNLRMPKITAALLKYRYRRLGHARALAKSEGFKGAMFPWQSGSDGREESQKVHLNPKSGRWIPDHSNIQRHVNSAIAYNFWRYFEATEDVEFLRSYGAEVILEIARFWASLSVYNENLDRYEILKVMGPDEYHDAYPGSDEPGLDNNAYTNVMAVWVLSAAVDLLHILPHDYSREIKAMMDLQDEEITHWKEITTKMRLCFHGDEIISQFEGYEKLKPFPWETYREKYKDIQRLDRVLEAEGDTANRYQVSKQADVLMLFYLFSFDELKGLFSKMGYQLTEKMIHKNIDYYLERTSHGSTLSRVVHSWVLARENRPQAWELFINALESDVFDVQGGTTPEGIHLGAMAGTVDIVQRCFTGIEIRKGILMFNPCLPKELKCLKLHLHYRGHSLDVEVNHEKLTLFLRFSLAKEITIGFRGETFDVAAGEKREFFLTKTKVHR